MLIGKAFLDSAKHQAPGFFEALGVAKPAPEAEQISTVTHLDHSGIAKRNGNQAGETRERDDVENVVMEDRDQAISLTRAKKLKVVMRDHFPGYVAFAVETQNLIFEVDQSA